MVKQLKQKARWLCAVMLLFMGFAESIQAQVNAYTFSQSTNTYTPNTNASGTRVVLASGTGTSNDDAVYNVMLPFTFTFNGTAYTSINVSTNGFITFGATAPSGSNYSCISSTATYSGAVAGISRDIIGIDASSELSHEQIGTPGFSTFVIEYKNVRPYNTAGRIMNFQIRLIEGFGIPSLQAIEVMYGSCTGIASNVTATTIQVGLRGLANTDFNNRTTTTDWSATTAGGTNAAAMTFTTTVVPSSGLTYSWMPPNCSAPAGLATSGITTTSATASWTDNGLGGYNWELRASGACGSGSPLQSGTNAFGDADVALTGLSPATTYTFCVQSDCGSSYTSTTFTTPCVAVALPYSEDFSSVTTPAIPSCWKTQDVNADANTWKTQLTGNTGTNIAGTYVYSSSNPGNDWFFTPMFNLTAGTTYRVKYKYGARSATWPEAMEVRFGLGQSAAGMTNTLATYNPISNVVTGSTGFIQASHDFTPASTGDYSIGFLCNSLADQFDLYIDDIEVMVAPTCLDPSAVAVGNITTTTADVSWTCAGCTGSFIVEYGAAGFTPGTGTTQTAASSPSTISGLTANTAYDVYVYQDCGAGDVSPASNPEASFTTACNAFTIPFSEDFTSVTTPAIPNCWTVENTNADNTTWITGLAGGTAGNNVARYIFNTDATTAADDWFFTPGLSLTGGTSYRLTFKYGARSATFPEALEIGYGMGAASGSMTTTLATIDPIANVASGTNGFLSYSVSFTPASTGTYNIGFHAISLADQWELYFDDVSVIETPACPDPIVSATNVQGTTADISWTCSGCTGTFVLEYGPTGFTPGTGATAGGGTVINPATSPTNLTGLTALTGYQVYVRQDCSGSFGPNSAVVAFTTGPDCATATVLTCGTPVTSNHTGTGVWNTTACGFPTPGQEQIYRFTAPQTGNYAIQVTAATGGYVDYFIKEATDGCTSTGWFCIYDVNAPISVYGLGLTAGVEYLLLLDPEGTTARSHTFQVVCPPAHDVPCGALALSVGANGPFANTAASADAGEVAPPDGGCNTRQTWCTAAEGVENSLWFTFVATSNRMRIVTDNFDSQVAVYSVTDCNDYSTFTLNSANDDGNGVASADTAYCLTPGNTYYVQVDGYDFAASASFNITVEDIGLDATFSGASNTCTAGGNQTLVPTMAGGTFAGPGVTGTTFNPATAGVGTHNITYTFPGLDNCVTTSQMISVVASTTYYQDLDGDTFGDNAVTVQACSLPVGFVAVGGDCDDNNNAVNPSALEVCDGIDNDCDGQTDESTLLWANGVGSTGTENVYEMTLDAMGNSYVVGSFTGTVDFGGTSLTAAGTDGYVAKYNNNGTLGWVMKVGTSTGVDEVLGVHVRNTDVYISGSLAGGTTMGSYTLTGKGSTDAFVAKLSSSGGGVQWAYNVGSTSIDVAYDVTTDESNNVYIAGCFNGTVDFDPSANISTIASSGLRDAYVAKYGSDGSFMWAKKFGGSATDRALKVTYNNNVVYVAGLYSSATTNEALTTAGADDIFLIAYDPMGTVIWKQSIGGNGGERLGDLIVDASGNTYIGGAYSGSCDFDPSAASVTYPTNGSNYDAFVGSYDNTGALRWARRMGGAGIDQANGLTIDGAELFITGNYRGLATFAGTTRTMKSLGTMDDIFVANYDLAGNFMWSKSLGGTSNDVGKAVAVNSSAEVYLAGTFQGTADFEVASSIMTNLVSNGGNDMYVAKINTCIATATMVANPNDEDTQNNTFAKMISPTGSSFEVYPNPNNGKFSVKAMGIVGNATIQVLDMTGKIVFTTVVSETNGTAETEIAIENATAGIYMVQIQTEAEMKTFKIEIQR